MKWSADIILTVLFFTAFQSQGQNYSLIKKIESAGSKFTTDHLGNIYLYKSGDVSRYNASGDPTGIYSSRDFGDISYIDATNPMKVLVVFAKFAKVVVLDNGLSANTSFDLALPGITDISLICSSRESGYWIFDPSNRKLVRMNEQLSIISEGTPWRQISDKPLKPVQILDSGNWLVVQDTTHGFLVFDRYGTYYKTVNAESKGGFQVSNDEILYKKGTGMLSVNIKSGIVNHFLLPQNQPDDECRVENKRIYLHDKDSLNIFSY